MHVINVIIPAYNEEASIGLVIGDIPAIVNQVIVVNNNSSDNTAQVAQSAGATVLTEKSKGYGYACLKAMDYIKNQEIKPDVIVFMDGDYSDYPEELMSVIAPIIDKDIDLVIGTRSAVGRAKNSMTPQQLFGNWLATSLMRLFFNATYTDLGPFRAIKYSKLLALEMQDKTYGWTVEMQLKVLKKKFSYTEVPVKYRERIGVSKVSGTVKGTVMAGIKILGWIFKYSMKK
ncbi:glycosyltransferase family 2 protein [Galbibacter sp.]|uniref:glycosyltransferase family 2 protein n=1 Tax=Galbibacter sp. TaxID=2918471 RepID=UPI002BC824ED|nr:glycosyltransferase family 2 protein [Galbibacter sp.]HLV62628.1 glycosyltransferase family 2 protein [Galbibacter sp.]